MSDIVKRRVDIVVSLWIDRDEDVSWVLQEMDMEFRHPAIYDEWTEIKEVLKDPETTVVDRVIPQG